MREFMNIVEGEGKAVAIDMLPASVKADILDMLIGPNGPTSFKTYWLNEHGQASFNDTYVAQFIFGTENLNTVGAYGGDTIVVRSVRVRPLDLLNPQRTVSQSTADKYAQRPGKFPPVLVRATNDGWKLIEGGHRVLAAIKRDDHLIDAVDVSPFFEMTTDDWESMWS